MDWVILLQWLSREKLVDLTTEKILWEWETIGVHRSVRHLVSKISRNCVWIGCGKWWKGHWAQRQEFRPARMDEHWCQTLKRNNSYPFIWGFHPQCNTKRVFWKALNDILSLKPTIISLFSSLLLSVAINRFPWLLVLLWSLIVPNRKFSWRMCS